MGITIVISEVFVDRKLVWCTYEIMYSGRHRKVPVPFPYRYRKTVGSVQ